MADQDDPLQALRIDRSQKPSASGGSRWILAFLALILTLGAAAWWWWQQNQVTEVEVAEVRQSSTAEAARASAVLDASGYVVARRRATVSSKVTGKIVEVLIDEGMSVEKGQVLARLDDAINRRQLSLTQAQLDSAKSSLAETRVRLAEAERTRERRRRLLAAEVGNQADLDAAAAEVDALAARLDVGQENIAVAERQLALQEQQLSDMVIRAPFDGVVVTKNAQPGEMISPTSAGGGFTRTGIGTVVDMGSLEIEVDVNEAYINRVRSEQKVEAVLDAYQDWRIPASVITTVPTADRQKATVRVRIAFDQLDPRILPDMGIKVSFLGEEEEETTAEPRSFLSVPLTAIHTDGDASLVYVLSGETLERRAVTLGPEHGSRVEVEAGLRPGEQVVTSGEDLSDGLRVRRLG